MMLIRCSYRNANLSKLKPPWSKVYPPPVARCRARVNVRMTRLASLRLAWSEALQLAVQQATALSEPKGRPSQGVSSLLADSLTCYELAQVCKLTLPPSELLVAQEALDRRHDAFLEEFDNFESKVSCDEPSPFVHPRLFGRSNDKRTRPC